MNKVNMENMTCPLPLADYPYVTMAHGGGGKMMQQLIDKMFISVFTKVQPHDCAILSLPQNKTQNKSQTKIAMTTDSFVVNPLFFPGGNIGTLAINGTVNDLAMGGARPQYISTSFILEEGLAMETLWLVVQAMGTAAANAEVTIVTGDTKVVERGRGDGIYINTTGIGLVDHDHVIAPQQVKAGAAVLISSDIGRHGIAVMAQREGLSLSGPIESDCAPLAAPVLDMLQAGIAPYCLRDATRGGVAAVLNEIATAAKLQIDISENAVPVHDAVRGACEIFGLDPLHIANEGCFIAFVSAKDKNKALKIMQTYNHQAAIIGTVKNGMAGMVTIETPIGGQRVLDIPMGEILPRIC